jgi:hypothetical protein
MKNLKQYRELFNTVASIGFLVILAYLLVSTALVLSWDWTAVPMFGAPFAPFQAGLGVTLVFGIVIGLIELLRDRK